MKLIHKNKFTRPTQEEYEIAKKVNDYYNIENIFQILYENGHSLHDISTIDENIEHALGYYDKYDGDSDFTWRNCAENAIANTLENYSSERKFLVEVFNIDWDIKDEENNPDDLSSEELNLPCSLLIDISTFRDILTQDGEINEEWLTAAINDYLSDEYNWLVVDYNLGEYLEN